MSPEQKRRPKTNGTARLMVLLNQMNNSNAGGSTARVLSEVLGFRDTSPRSELLAFAKLNQMIESAEREAKVHLDYMWSTAGPHYEGIRNCFIPSLSSTPWSQRKASLTASDMTGLRHTSAQLQQFVGEKELADDDTAQLSEAIRGMEASLETEKGISKHTREVLSQRLEAIKFALDEYKLWGVAEMERAFREFAGTLTTDRAVRTDFKKAKRRKSRLVYTMLAVVLAVGKVLEFANSALEFDIKTLPEIKQMVLPPPSAPASPPATAHLESI